MIDLKKKKLSTKKTKFIRETQRLIKEYETNQINLSEYKFQMAFLRGECGIKS